jgi:uncharacterized Zn ribbon protein
MKKFICQNEQCSRIWYSSGDVMNCPKCEEQVREEEIEEKNNTKNGVINKRAML